MHVKRAFKYRFYPTDAQAAELSRTFGCVRKVYNLALAARTQAWALRQERVNYTPPRPCSPSGRRPRNSPT
ncbi:transposase [Streptomyces hygroscopicus]|nr:transposase [Streptomyces hygroscopicus]